MAIRLMPERDCVGCTKQDLWGCRAKKWKDHPSYEPDKKENWVNPSKQSLCLSGEETYACPRQTLKENPQYWTHIFRYYGMYKQGFLPAVGGVMDQSNKAMEVFHILDEANIACDNEDKKETRGRPSSR